MSKKLLGIEIADTSVRYIYLERVAQKTQISQFGELPIRIDLSAPGQIADCVDTICQKGKIAPERIALAINRKDILIHQIILPKIPELELEEVLATEIEKLPAFHHGQFDYIHQAHVYREDKYKVTFAALAKNIIDNIRQDLTITKMAFQDIEIAPLNLAGILASICPLNQWEIHLVVNHQHSTLCIQEKNQISVFYRSAIGSQHLSEPNPALGSRHTYAVWTGELNRLIKSFLLENRTAKITKIRLIWDQELLPDLPQQVANDLGIAVEIPEASKIRGVTLSNDSKLNPKYLLALTPLLYHALHIREQFPLNHFLMPRKSGQNLLKVVLLSSLMILSSFILFHKAYLFVNTKTAQITRENSALERQIKNLTKESQDLLQRQQEFLTIRQRLLDQATYVNQLNRVSWSQVFAIFSHELPEELALNSFRFIESGKAVIKGDAFNMDAIAALIRRIEDSKILEQGKFDFLTEKKHEDLKYFSFGILAQLKSIEQESHEKKTNQ
jgi:Tfp pilus assembly protein PilN